MPNLSPPRCLARVFPGATWCIPNSNREVYITFDDGPVPGVTDWVLDELQSRGVHATFFCLGRNAERYPELLDRIVHEGHAVGNHTYSHLRGFEVGRMTYYDDVVMANELLHSDLFRPPYGRITFAQARLLALRFRLVLWSVLSMDYSKYMAPAECLQIVQHCTRSGDIVVFHDSWRAERNLRYALPRALDYLLAAGFVLAPLKIPEPVPVPVQGPLVAIPCGATTRLLRDKGIGDAPNLLLGCTRRGAE